MRVEINMKTIATKFVSGEVPELNSLKNSRAYTLRERLNAGEKISREEKNWIASQVNHSTFFKKAIALRGYRFDFSDVLKEYIVLQYGHYQAYWAIDKTSLRTILFGRVDRIIEV